MSLLKPGPVGKAELIVDQERTAKSVGSVMIGVPATPVMIHLNEAAALPAIEAHLPDRCQSLGTYLEVSHVAATPVGRRVSAIAELVKVERCLLEFRACAIDEVEEIGAGTHRRMAVNVGKFVSRVARKTPAE